MDPKDWNKIKKLLGGLADQETADEILKLLGQGVFAQCVKSIQKQAVNVSSASTVFTISEVNSSKSVVLVDGGSYDGGNTAYTAVLAELTDTSVVLNTKLARSTYAVPVGIQVVEFY